jgi:hypothetical protein
LPLSCFVLRELATIILSFVVVLILELLTILLLSVMVLRPKLLYIALVGFVPATSQVHRCHLVELIPTVLVPNLLPTDLTLYVVIFGPELLRAALIELVPVNWLKSLPPPLSSSPTIFDLATDILVWFLSLSHPPPVTVTVVTRGCKEKREYTTMRALLPHPGRCAPACGCCWAR